MAKVYDIKRKVTYWTASDIACPLEDAYWELSDFLAVKRLDGHDMRDQWYMKVHQKMGELLDALGDDPTDELDANIRPIY